MMRKLSLRLPQVRMVRARTMRVGHRQAGVGMIEVLIAVLVLAIAFLGVAALQAMSLSTNNSAMARSMATVASYSILDAMRADITNASNGAYNNTGSNAINASKCPAAAASLASAQLNLWCTKQLANLGTPASTTGDINCAANGLCTVTVTFDDSRAGVGGSSQQKVTTVGRL